MIRVLPQLLVLTLLCCIALFGAVARTETTEPATPPATPVDEKQEDLLRFLAATQLQTSALYSKLSFKADVTDHAYVRELDKIVPVRSKYTVSKRGNTSLINKTLLTTFKGGALSELPGPIEVSNEPNVTRMLRTPDYLMLWREVAVPYVVVWFTEDWKLQDAVIESEWDRVYRQVRIEQKCFGVDVPIHELIPQSIRSYWTAVPAQETGIVRIQRKLRFGGQNGIADLEFLVDSGMGTVQKATFMPGGGKTESTVSIEYGTLEANGAKVVVPFSYVKESGIENPVRKQQTRITFSDYADETEMPPFTVEQLGIPVGARISCRLPGYRGENDYREERKVWDGNIQAIEQWRMTK